MIQILRLVRRLYLVHIKWKDYSFGKNIYIGRSVQMWAKHSIIIGDNFYIGKFSQIECDAVIGNNVMFANFVALVGRHDHNYSEIGVPMRQSRSIRDKDYDWKGLDEKLEIGDDVWVGHGSIILSGSRISEGSIIAAGSVVTGNVEPYSIYAGNPAVKIKNRFANEEQKAEHIRLISSVNSKHQYGVNKRNL